MKRVACISNISIPEGSDISTTATEIFSATRVFAEERGITGAFLVAGKISLQVMEGEATALGNLVFKLRSDQRLKEFSLIYNNSNGGDKPLFPSWGLSAVNKSRAEHQKFLAKLQKMFAGSAELKSDVDKERLDHFLSCDCMPRVVKDRANSTGKKKSSNEKTEEVIDIREGLLSLSCWPKPGQIKLTPDLIRLCARLVRRPTSFSELINARVLNKETDLERYVTELNELGLLEKRKPGDWPKLKSINGGAQSMVSNSSVDRFAQKLRSFLTAARI